MFFMPTNVYEDIADSVGVKRYSSGSLGNKVGIITSRQIKDNVSCGGSEIYFLEKDTSSKYDAPVRLFIPLKHVRLPEYISDKRRSYLNHKYELVTKYMGVEYSSLRRTPLRFKGKLLPVMGDRSLIETWIGTEDGLYLIRHLLNAQTNIESRDDFRNELSGKFHDRYSQMKWDENNN